jgi:ATP-dependent DNA helicase RecG
MNRKSETHRIEHKRELTPELDLEKEVIAFLNTPEGGLIFIGIDKTGQRVGVADLDGDMLKIKDRIKHNVTPSAMGLFDVVDEAQGGTTCIKIIVAGGSEKPYFKKKYGMTERGCFLRIGTAAEPMPAAMIEKLFASRTRNSIGKIKSHRQELSFEQLRIYYEEKRKPLNRQFRTNLELTTEDGALNYAAYLLADENGLSMKVAKYRGKDRVHLIESNEYGYCSLIKATKSVLDKLDLENKTSSTITAKERRDVRLWNSVALREAVINAIVHNDYTREVPPKFELFADRIEITSACSLPEGLTQAEFFAGYSIPRNKELMRIFKDLDMVEHLGSGLPRITEFYGAESFRFTENFLRITFAASRPVHEEEATEQVEARVEAPVEARVEAPVEAPVALTKTDQKILTALAVQPLGRSPLLTALGYSQPTGNYKAAMAKLLQARLIEPTLPDKPNSRLQQYRLTEKGRSLLP